MRLVDAARPREAQRDLDAAGHLLVVLAHHKLVHLVDGGLVHLVALVVYFLGQSGDNYRVLTEPLKVTTWHG